MSSSDDERRAGEGDNPLAGIDLDAWQPPPVRGGLADAVVQRMREPAAVTPHEIGAGARRRGAGWMIGGALLAAAGVVTGLVVAGPRGTRRTAPTVAGPTVPTVTGPSASGADRGDVVAERASHLELGASSADLDAGTALTWRREGARVSVVQRRGTATWRVGRTDNLVIDAGAMGASVEATGASLRVEVRMQLSSSDARVVAASAATAAVVALVTVIVYQGHVKASSGSQTVNVAAGSAVEIKPGEPPREQREVAAAPGEPRTVGPADRDELTDRLDPANRDELIDAAALATVGGEIKACLDGQAIQLTATGKVRPDGTVETIVVEPRGPVASCLESAIRRERFAAMPGGHTFHRDFSGSIQVPASRNVAPTEIDKLRIKGDPNIMPDEADKHAIESAFRLSGESRDARLIASLKFCIDRTGKVSHVRQLKSSGYPGYDQKLQNEVIAWQYRPYKVDGKPVPVCTAVTFVYKQS
jgi:hypothetical protein